MKRIRTTRSVPASKRVSYAPVTRVVSSAGVGLGQSAKTVLKTEFFANVTPSATTGVFTGYLKPGSCFDPCGDIAAIQPALYDQWSAIYGRYVVEKATVKIEFVRQSVAASPSDCAFVAAAYPSITSTALSTYQGAASQPFAKSVLCGTNDNSSSNSLFFSLDHAKVLGRKGSVTAEDNGAVPGADPAVGEFMVLPIFIQNSQNSALSVTMRITMYQTVHFDRRVNLVDA